MPPSCSLHSVLLEHMFIPSLAFLYCTFYSFLCSSHLSVAPFHLPFLLPLAFYIFFIINRQHCPSFLSNSINILAKLEIQKDSPILIYFLEKFVILTIFSEIQTLTWLSPHRCYYFWLIHIIDWNVSHWWLGDSVDLWIHWKHM